MQREEPYLGLTCTVKRVKARVLRRRTQVVHVSQNAERREVLDLISRRLGCGRIRANHRASADTTLVYVVRRREDLLTRVIPFFETQPLLSSKQRDFLAFAGIVRAMDRGEHLTNEGLAALVDRALSMNGGGPYRRVHGMNASGILRDHTPNTLDQRG